MFWEQLLCHDSYYDLMSGLEVKENHSQVLFLSLIIVISDSISIPHTQKHVMLVLKYWSDFSSLQVFFLFIVIVTIIEHGLPKEILLQTKYPQFITVQIVENLGGYYCPNCLKCLMLVLMQLVHNLVFL